MQHATSYARVSARSGLDIVFDKEACLRKVNGEEVYAAGFYDPENNRIVVNPDAKKKHASLLIHELSHAIRSYVGKDNKIHFLADKNAKISPELWEKVKKHYSDQKVSVTRMELMLDEACAYYAEEILGTEAALDLLLGKKKTLKEKILSFFKGAARDYSGDEKLSKEARKFLRTFKKMFDAFTEKNQSVKAENSEGVNKNVDSVRFSMDYEGDIDALDKGTFEVKNNSHLRVLEHTPQIFIDKAGAKDRPIVMSWDIAYLAMKRRAESDEVFKGINKKYDEALDNGNYHGLGVEFMKRIPKALENPLYIVRQPNGRICAVTEMLYKSKRPIFAVIELEAYTSITQEGKIQDDTYNLIVTVSNGQPRYFKNNVFNGDIVYNKNKEDPAHFISRLQSLDKLTPKNDLAGSSKDIIPDSAEKVNTSEKKSSDSGRRFSMDEEPKLPRTAGTMSVGQYKQRVADLNSHFILSWKNRMGSFRCNA